MKNKLTTLSKILSNLEIGKDCDKFKNEITDFYGNSDPILVNVLVKAAKGDNRELNNWLYGLPSEFKELVPWIGKVKTGKEKKYVWLVGIIDNTGQTKVRKLLDNAWKEICNDLLFFHPEKRAPYITYLRSIVCSEWQKTQDLAIVTNKIPQFGRIGMFVEGTALPHNKPLTPDHHEGINMSSDIEIFQVNYSNDTTEDIDQKMPLNSDYFIYKTNELFKRIKRHCTKDTISFYEKNVLPNANIITKLHAEIHNQGHFVGPVIYTQKEKNEETYEAIEEFRACLTASAVTAHLDINEEIYWGLPVHIFLMRFLGFGYDSYLSEKNDIVNIREMEVGALFFNMLEKQDGLKMSKEKLDLSFASFPLIFRKEVEFIHKMEVDNKQLGKKGLAKIAKNYRQTLYTETKQNAQSYYKFLDLEK